MFRLVLPRGALQRAVEAEAARLQGIAAAASSQAARKILQLKGLIASDKAKKQQQQLQLGEREQLQAGGSGRIGQGQPKEEQRLDQLRSTPALTMLTTSLSSMVLRTLIEAHKAALSGQGTSGSGITSSSKGLRVIVCESRPLCEGVTLARRLAAAGVQVTVITDAQVLGFMKEVDAVLLGCDAVVTEGVVNKVGSGILALAAQARDVPVLVVGDSLKVSPGPLMATCLPKVLGVEDGGSQEEEKGWEELVRGWKEEDVEGVKEWLDQRKGAGEGGSAGKAREDAEDEEAGSVGGNGSGTGPAQDSTRGGAVGVADMGGSNRGSIAVRNVYFEVVPWELVGCLITEEGDVPVEDMVKSIQEQKQKYMEAFDFIVA